VVIDVLEKLTAHLQGQSSPACHSAGMRVAAHISENLRCFVGLTELAVRF